MLYLLDANVLIDANRDYYPIERVPEFWNWLIYMGNNGKVKIPIEVYEEIKEGNDSLAKWTKSNETQAALLFLEEVEVDLVAFVVDNGYAQNLTDIEIVKLGRDPFLIAYGLRAKKSRCIVTTEVSKPKRLGANRHVPDVCDDLGIFRCNTFEFIRSLNFSTNWQDAI